jgi:capsular polysaccharide biosynthesis protein
MARQQRLMSTLADAPPEAAKASTMRLDEATLAALRAAESAAIVAAEEHLSRGELEPAEALLKPHAKSARLSRTLTLLSRLQSAQGRFDEAEQLLQRADALNPADVKVPYFMAELLTLLGEHQRAIQYRRRVAYATKDAPVDALLKLIHTIAKASVGTTRPPLAELRQAIDRLRESHSGPEALAEAARAVFSVPKFRKDAIALMGAGDPCPAESEDIEATWKPLADWCTSASIPVARLDSAGLPGRRPRMATVQEVIVAPGMQWLPLVDQGRVLVSDLAASRMRLRHEAPSSPLLLSDNARGVVRMPRSRRSFDGPAILIGGVGNYYHDLVEYVGVLAVAEALGIAENLPLVLPAEPAPHQQQLLSLLGYTPDRFIGVRPDELAEFSSLIVTSRLAAGGQYIDPMLPQWYRTRLVGKNRVVAHRKLYLTRAGASRRRVANEEEVRSLLTKHGFEVVAPEALSVSEQIALFAQATHIAGATGAAMTNMLFAPPGAVVTVFYNQHLAKGGGDLYFDAMARACGHTIATVDSAAVSAPSGHRVIDADIRVPIDMLEHAINNNN